MVGLPDGATVEIEFTAGVWTDVSAYVAAEAKVSGQFGRRTEFDDVGPASLTLVLRNDDGRFTPDSTGSPYYPDVIEGRRLRVTVTHGVTPYRLFTGPILSWEPNYAARRLDAGTVTVTANDHLATLALHTLDSRWVEETRALARTAGTWVDVYVLTGDAATTAWDNIGVTTGGTLGTATLVSRIGGFGEIAYAAPAALIVESAAELKPTGDLGVVPDIAPAAAPAAINLWFRLPERPGRNDTRVLTLRSDVDEVAALRVDTLGLTADLDVYVSSSPVTTLVTGIDDDVWRLLTLTASGTSTVITLTDVAGVATTYTAAFDLSTVTHVLVGGEVATGYAQYCPRMYAAGLSVAGAAAVTPAYTRAIPGQTQTHTSLFTSLQSYVPEVTTWATTGGEVRTVGEPTWTGRTALAVLQTIARTINGVAYCTGDGAVTLAAADVVRPTTSAATIDIWEDLDAEAAMPQMRRAADSRPTRVAITYAGGSINLVDTAAEANRQPRREVKLDTCAADAEGAAFAGQYLLDAANGLRITQIAIDLTTSLTDLWAVMLGLYPTQRLTVGGFDASLIGDTELEVFAQGWKVDLDHESLRYVLDCSPSAQFVGAVWDAGDDYGRWAAGSTMTVTAGTALGVTTDGTLVITTSGSNPTLTTDPGDYPLYLDWLGEYVQVSSPPAGSTSPQTVTTTGRGLFGTAARTNHVSGEALELWHPALWNF